jgi:hypothetical protein
LRSAGIGEPARSRLAALPHVTPEYVRAHARHVRNLGQVIYRIEHEWPAPGEWGEQRLDAKRGDSCADVSEEIGDRKLDIGDSNAEPAPEIGEQRLEIESPIANVESPIPNPQLPMTNDQSPTTPAAQAAWAAALDALRLDTSRATFDRWLKDVTLAGYSETEGRFTLQARDKWGRQWLEGRMRPALARALSAATGRAARVDFSSPD